MKVTHSTTTELKQLSWLWCIGIWLLKCTKSQVLGQERCNIITKWFTWSGSDAHLNSLLQRGVVNSEISRGLYFYYKFTSEKLIFICVRVCVCVLKVQFCFKGVMETYLPSIGQFVDGILLEIISCFATIIRWISPFLKINKLSVIIRKCQYNVMIWHTRTDYSARWL